MDFCAIRPPSGIVAGDSLEWTCSLSEYPAPGWTLHYVLVMTGQQIKIDATASGSDHHVKVPASESVAWAPGRYSYRAYVAHAGNDERRTLQQGTVEVRPNYANASGGLDDRTHVAQTLEALEATILGRASNDQLSYSIAGRSLSRMSMNELLQWRDHYKAELKREERALRQSRGDSVVRVQFNA